MAIVLSGKFPGFTAGFPGVGSKSAHFGQKVSIFWIEAEKFAVKFAAPGNLLNFRRLTSFSFGQPAAPYVSTKDQDMA
jgi:hypothetical protein